MTSDEALVKLLDASKQFLIAATRFGLKVKPVEKEYEALKVAVAEASMRYHKPGHALHGFPLQRRETGLLEVRCNHGVGHPIPESVKFMAFATKQTEDVWSTHGCDGCCHA